VIHGFGADTLLLTRTSNGRAVEVRRESKPGITTRRVVLELLVGVDGAVKDGRIASPSGNPERVEAALETARSWKLVPAQEDGKPVEKWGKFAVQFRLVDE
jgi:TonB family protein